MSRTAARPTPTTQEVLEPLADRCAHCGRRTWADYENRRTVTTLSRVIGLRLKIRRCHNECCPRYLRPCRPEAEGAIALPEHEFGLDVIALVGALRYGQHRSVPEIHQGLTARGVIVCQRTVTNLLDRYDELVALSIRDDRRLRKATAAQGRVVLALDGLQPDVGHEVLWVLRDCLSGEVLLARSLLSAAASDLAGLIESVKSALGVPIAAVLSDGQHSIRNAVKAALPGVPHHLCHFHYLREAGRPLYEMDRHAKKELKKRVRGVRPIERRAEGKDDPRSRATRRYCAAVRSAITDDGRPPLEASGLKLQRRLGLIERSLGRLAKKGRPAAS
jgi:hypothetical protein